MAISVEVLTLTEVKTATTAVEWPANALIAVVDEDMLLKLQDHIGNRIRLVAPNNTDSFIGTLGSVDVKSKTITLGAVEYVRGR